MAGLSWLTRRARISKWMDVAAFTKIGRQYAVPIKTTSANMMHLQKMASSYIFQITHRCWLIAKSVSSAGRPATRHPNNMISKTKILVSACLLGEPVRYDGQSKPLNNQVLETLNRQNCIIAFCPEIAGGLSTPREPAEILLERVVTESDNDLTEAFLQGANETLSLCQKHSIRVAILTEFSPSCGSNQIYDGSFSRQRINGEGITTSLLRDHGVKVFNQHQISNAVAELNQLD